MASYELDQVTIFDFVKRNKTVYAATQEGIITIPILMANRS